MKLLVHRFEPPLIHMGVDLGRGDVCVAQHLLDDTKIRAVIQQMGRKRMPQLMRMHADI